MPRNRVEYLPHVSLEKHYSNADLNIQGPRLSNRHCFKQTKGKTVSKNLSDKLVDRSHFPKQPY